MTRRTVLQRNASLIAGITTREVEHAKFESECKASSDGLAHAKETLADNMRELETIRAEKAQRDDRNREGLDMQMKYDEAAEGIRKSGACDGMSDAQTKKIIIVSVATG